MRIRSQSADLLKGTAIILMIQVHIVELFASNSIMNSSSGKILLFLGGPPVAPVFVFLMGFFLAQSEKSRKQLILRGIKIFCLGMLLNLALNMNLIISTYRGVLKINILPYIFGFDILQFAGISIILIALIKKILQKHLIFAFAAIFLAGISSQILSEHIPQNDLIKYILAPFFGSANWSYFPLLPWIAYPLAGFILFHLSRKMAPGLADRISVKLLFGIFFLAFMISTIKYSIGVSSDLSLYYHHGFLFMAWVLAFLFFYGLGLKWINDRLGEFFILKYMKWLGKNVTLIYIIQWTIIGNIATQIYKSLISPVHLFAYFFCILITSSLLALSLVKITKRFNISISRVNN